MPYAFYELHLDCEVTVKPDKQGYAVTTLQNLLRIHTGLAFKAVSQSWANMCKEFRHASWLRWEVHLQYSFQCVTCMWCGELQIRGAEPSVGSAANPGKIGEGIANNINGPDPKGAASEVCTCCCCSLCCCKMSLCTASICEQALGYSAG